MSRLAGFLVLCSCLSAHATSCGGIATVCSSFSASSVVFLGRVLEAKPWPAPCERHTYPDGTSATGCWGPEPEDFRFEILEVFKGNPGREITVTGGDQQFKKGGRYLVFAVLNPATQIARTGLCIDNHAVADPNLDPDVKWLRAYPTAPLTATISGKINLPYEEIAAGYRDADLPSVKVELTGAKDLTASTGTDNRYSFEDLPPGIYTLTAVAPAGHALWSQRDTTTVNVGAKGCVEVDWWIGHDPPQKGRN